TVDANSSVTITIVATAAPNLSNDAITFTNSASVSANKGDDNTGNNTSNTVTTTQPGIGAPPGGTATIAQQIDELILQVKTASAMGDLVNGLEKTQRELARNHVKGGCDQLGHFLGRLKGVQKDLARGRQSISLRRSRPTPGSQRPRPSGRHSGARAAS